MRYPVQCVECSSNVSAERNNRSIWRIVSAWQIYRTNWALKRTIEPQVEQINLILIAKKACILYVSIVHLCTLYRCVTAHCPVVSSLKGQAVLILSHGHALWLEDDITQMRRDNEDKSQGNHALLPMFDHFTGQYYLLNPFYCHIDEVNVNFLPNVAILLENRLFPADFAYLSI